MTKSKATLLIIIVCIGSVFAVKTFAQHKASGSANIELSRTKGDIKARLHIIEYLDFQCPACAVGALTLREYLKKYPSDIYLQLKYYPISRIHEHAMLSATYAECAARQNKFWDFFDRLIDKQSQWSRLLNADSVFRDIARDANLDLSKLASCLEDDSVKTAVLRDKEGGKTLGVESTPTYFINGKMTVGPRPLLEELQNSFGEKNNQ